jgi:glycosyltransferase involved in cell wall biosynthesis
MISPQGPHTPRILMIAPVLPSATGSGLAMRLGLFLEGLGRVGAVDLVVIRLVGQGPRDDLAETHAARLWVIETAGRSDTEFDLLRRLPHEAMRLAAFRAYGGPSLASGVSAAVLEDLRTVTGAARYDLVHVGRAYLARAGLALAAVPAVLSMDLDDDDAVAFRREARLARAAGEPARADWLDAEADAFDRLQDLVAAEYRAVAIAGRPALRSIARRHPGLCPVVVRNAVAIPARPRRRDDGRTLLFVGSLDYGPNRDGLSWFLDAVWPRLASARPGLRLLVAGPGARGLRPRPGLELLGPVATVTPLYEAASLALAPIRSGSGTRVKLIEAAAHGVPFVTTGLGAEGLDFRADEGWFGDSPGAFAQACLSALGDPAECARRAERARRRVLRDHDRQSVAGEIAAWARTLLADVSPALQRQGKRVPHVVERSSGH